MRNPAVGYAEISVFGRILCVGLECDRILRGGSKVPHQWFIDKHFLSHEIFSRFLIFNTTDFLYVDCYSSKILEIW